MSSYRKYNWPQLFSDFEQSDLTQAAFCKEREINDKYFSQKWSQHKAGKSSAFVPLTVASKAPVASGVVLELGVCTIRCPASMPTSSIAALVKALL